MMRFVPFLFFMMPLFLYILLSIIPCLVFSLEEIGNQPELLISLFPILGFLVIFYLFGYIIGWQKIYGFLMSRKIPVIGLTLLSFAPFALHSDIVFSIPFLVSLVLWISFLFSLKIRTVRIIFYATFCGAIVTLWGGNQQEKHMEGIVINTLDSLDSKFANDIKIVCDVIDSFSGFFHVNKNPTEILRSMNAIISKEIAPDYYLGLFYYKRSEKLGIFVEQDKIRNTDTSYIKTLENLYEGGKETVCPYLRGVGEVGCPGDLIGKINLHDSAIIFVELRSRLELFSDRVLVSSFDGFAVYCGGILTSFGGDIPYPYSLDSQLIMELHAPNKSIKKTYEIRGFVSGYENIVIKKDETFFIFTSKRHPVFYHLGGFSLIFILMSISLHLPSFATNLITAKKKIKTLTGRIELSTSLAYISFVAIMIVIFLVALNERKNESKKNIIKEMRQIQELFRQKYYAGYSYHSIFDEIINMFGDVRIIPAENIKGGEYEKVYELLASRKESLFKEYADHYYFLLWGDKKEVALVGIPKNRFWQGILREGLSIADRLMSAGSIMLILFALFAAYRDRVALAPLEFLKKELQQVQEGKKKYIAYSQTDEISQIVALYNRAVDAVAQIEKEEAWKQSMREFLHEVMNCITPLFMKLQQMQVLKETNPERYEKEAPQIISTAYSSIKTMIEIVNNFRNYGKLFFQKKEPVDIYDVVQEVVNVVASPSIVNINVAAREMVLWNREQAKIVFTNLIKNALEACSSVKEPQINVSITRNENKLIVSVADNGGGIPTNIIDKIFLPGFTTKEEGSGQGLFITKKMVENAGGSISVKSEQGWTTFTVSLPLMQS